MFTRHNDIKNDDVDKSKKSKDKNKSKNKQEINKRKLRYTRSGGRVRPARQDPRAPVCSTVIPLPLRVALPVALCL